MAQLIGYFLASEIINISIKVYKCQDTKHVVNYSDFQMFKITHSRRFTFKDVHYSYLWYYNFS